MKKTIIASAILMMSASVFAADAPVDHGHGVINFVGSIVDAPCSIAPESVDQTIQMGQISNVLLEKNGETPLRPIEVHLESCSLETAKAATMTFTGNGDAVMTKSLAIQGSGKGAAIALVNMHDSSSIELGTKTKGISLIEGENILNFGAKLVGTVKEGEKAVPGEFTATANFMISYE
ncbi:MULTISPECIES: fimbrial protein [Vibrio]|uniref:Type 1 fimbrial protein n=1 Tax=Vibrio metschnikovii TaxID=28172 RepID=A0A9X0R8P1_VIBME|nr:MULTISPECIES: fimbrial protein [Vibrio]MBC5850906.1 type 1 fimbrial protein [Vibrio metschnikovii]PXA74568.1 fimbrial protein [Vibrio sp. 11986-1-5]